MILGIVQQASDHDTSWFYPKYWPMLTSWADELVRTTEFPANQICTDDFTGKLANNTNLGCKGIIAVEVYAQLCKLTNGGWRACKSFSACMVISISYSTTGPFHAALLLMRFFFQCVSSSYAFLLQCVSSSNAFLLPMRFFSNAFLLPMRFFFLCVSSPMRFFSFYVSLPVVLLLLL
jgi:hypothetical protein